jgi:hypothetical protein
VTKWEYARLEYRAAGTFGNDANMDWTATFTTAAGVQSWGQDERFNDIAHLNRAGQHGWECYNRHGRLIGQPQRLNAITYSFKRRLPE